MGVFTDQELAYLQAQPLMRFASASPKGRPDVATVVFSVDGDDIVTGGFDITKTIRYRNITKNRRATVVIDDLAGVDPWSPRGIKVRGSARIESGPDGERFRISPEVIWSWNINDVTDGTPAIRRREVG
jgi:pyridoxamine 5'-phosphate oxidase family protein